MLTCRTCCRPVASPFRVYDPSGKIISGCVGKDHDGHLTPLSDSLRWHNRPEAKALRKADKTIPLAEVPALAARTFDRASPASANILTREYKPNVV